MMNEQIKKLSEQAYVTVLTTKGMENIVDGCFIVSPDRLEKFAELIVEECRNVVSEVYRKTPLELCGPLLTADEEIAKHFYGVES
jgi:hypothetical protein